MKRTAIVLAATAAVLLLAGPASAQYPEEAAIAISDTSIACPGDDLTITGEGFLPGFPVDVFFDGDLVATVNPGADGAFSVTITAPGAAAGQHTVSAESEGPDGGSASASVTCVGAAVAFTGANISVGLILLIALVAIGGVALYAGRRRARSAA